MSIKGDCNRFHLLSGYKDIIARSGPDGDMKGDLYESGQCDACRSTIGLVRRRRKNQEVEKTGWKVTWL